jgi:carboxypeptidase family protein
VPLLKNVVTVLAAAASCAAYAPVVQGQHIHGVVIDAGSGRPIEGAVVTLTRADSMVARRITDVAGRFAVSVPRDGTVLVRAEQFGFETVLREVRLQGADTISVRLGLSVRPVAIRGVEASVVRGCRDPDSPTALAAVWIEARDLLEALMRRSPPGTKGSVIETVMSDLDPSGRIVHRTVRDTTESSGGMPMRSPSPEVLARHGFIEVVGGSANYFGPDAEALLSDEFLFGHCFGRDTSREAEGWIGLAFDPRPDRESIHDIRGVLWLPRGSDGEPRIDFSWVSHPWGIQASPDFGGTVDLAPVGETGWQVDRWNMTVPRPMTTNQGGGGPFVVERRHWSAARLDPEVEHGPVTVDVSSCVPLGGNWRLDPERSEFFGAVASSMSRRGAVGTRAPPAGLQGVLMATPHFLLELAGGRVVLTHGDLGQMSVPFAGGPEDLIVGADVLRVTHCARLSRSKRGRCFDTRGLVANVSNRGFG